MSHSRRGNHHQPTSPPLGRHEHGQNFLNDPAVIHRVVDLVRPHHGPIVEWGTGDGALTLALASLGRPIEGVELDARRAMNLSRRVGPHVAITTGDILRHAPPVGSVLVSNVPFNLTTPVLRHLLASRAWAHAVLIVQWEVARKRAGVGGATQLTAQWWPWYDFTLDQRIPASAFTPRPSVDAGILQIERRVAPRVPLPRQWSYQAWVASVFRGRGRGLADILQRQGVPGPLARKVAANRQRKRPPLPRDLRAHEWAELYLAR